MGTRYNPDTTFQTYLRSEVPKAQKVLDRWLLATRNFAPVPVNERHVIAMSLYGGDDRYTFGAIRNAQLRPVIFPGWTL